MAVDVWHFTDSSGFGGAELAMLNLIEGLDRTRWRSTIVHHDAPGLAPLLDRAEDSRIRTVSIDRMPDGVRGAVRMWPFRRVLRAARPAIFHANLPSPLAAKYPLAAAVTARVPAVIATVHLYPSLRPTRLIVAQRRLLARAVDRYIAVSYAVGERLHYKLGWPADRIDVIHNGIDGAQHRIVRDDTVRRSLTTVPGSRVVLCVGRLTEQKGFRFAIEALPRLPDVSLAVAGEGPERAMLEAQASALGVAGRVRFLGSRDDVPQLLAAADAFVLPSLWEGLPLSLIEAMAARRPIVATSIPGVEEAVADERTALLVPPRDARALAVAIRRVLDEPATAARLVNAAAQRQASDFSLDTMVGRVELLYTGLLGRRPVR